MWRWLLLLVVVAAVAPGAAAARPGDLDTTFGDGGEVVTPFRRLTTVMAIDPQGRILVGGDTLSSIEPPGLLARYDANGRLDPTFGIDGIAEVPPGRRPASVADVALTPDGRVLVAAATTVPVSGGMRDAIVVVRLTEDGSADLSFAQGEVLISGNVGYDLRDPRLLVHDDGRVSVASVVCDASICPGVALFRFTGDGAPLGSELTFDGLEDLILGGVALANDDSVRVAAKGFDGGFPFVFVHLNAEGGFVDRVTTNLRLSRYQSAAIHRAPGDRLLGLGMGTGPLSVQRFLSDGRPDPAYTTTTLAPSGTRLPEAAAIALQTDGRAVIGGSIGVFRGPHDWFLAMLLADGGLDPGFGEDGSVEELTESSGSISAVGVQPDGRIVALGQIGSSVLLRRYEGSARACGDADGDATLTVTDGIRVLRAAAELPSSCLAAFCDTDASGSTTVTDGVRVLRAVAALPADLDCAPAH